MLELYQFPISHYCEKVRWALDYKGLHYKRINLLPGLHLRTTKKVARHSYVPILRHGKEYVQGSASIITYLDEHFPQQRLTPKDPVLREQALKWEQYVDSEIGPHVRRVCYDTLLHHPEVVIPFFTHEGPWYGKLYVNAVYGQLVKTMRKLMDINPDSAATSQAQVSAALDEILQAMRGRDYLVGDTFTRADLATAALFAPIILPPAYGLPWPQKLPESLANITNVWQPKLSFVERWYQDHRHAA